MRSAAIDRPPWPSWSEPQSFAVPPLGPGLETSGLAERLAPIAADPRVLAIVVFGSRARGEARTGSDLDLLVLRRGALTPAQRHQAWAEIRRQLGVLPVNLDLLVEDEATAAKMRHSRWHVLGRIDREGLVLHAA